MDNFQLLGIFISLVFSAFFSGIEIAFISADPIYLQIQRDKGGITARALNYFTENPTIFITTTLIGNTVALVLYGTFMAKLTDPWFNEVFAGSEILKLSSQTILSTILVLFVAEFLPKSLFLLGPNNMLALFALPIRLIIFVFYPLVITIVFLSKIIITKVFQGSYNDARPVYGLTDLSNFILKIYDNDNDDDSSDEKHEVDTEIFTNAVEFKRIKVRDCMVPRTDIIAVDIEDDIQDLKNAFISSGHTKVLVYKESIDDIVGYCHSSELFKKPKNIKDIVTDIPFVPETKLANDLMVELNRKHKSLALVVDEFGGTAGVVSIEDIVEEIFGEIQDEHDSEDLVEHRIDDFNYIFSGRHEIEYINEEYKFNLQEGDFDTLGGLIYAKLGEIPKVGDVIELEHCNLIIRAMNGIKVDRVLLTLQKG